MDFIISIIPIVILLVLLLGFKTSIKKAAFISLFYTLLASVYLGADGNLIAVSFGKGLWMTVWIIYIIWPALLVYKLIDTIGGFKVIEEKFKRFSDKLLQLLIVGWIFPSFLQGVTGFGTPVVVTAPLLMGMGYSPFISAIVPLIGCAWSVTFGSMGASYLAARLVTQLGPEESLIFAAFGAFFLSLICILTGFVISYIYGGFKAVKKGFLHVLILGISMGFTLNLMVKIEPCMASFTSGIVGLIFGFLLVRRNKKIENKKGMSFHSAFLPYYILIGVVLLVMLTPQISSFANTHCVFGFSFPETSTSIWTNPAIETYNPIKIFAHPGSFILFSAFISYIIYKKKGFSIDTKKILRETTSKTIPSFISIAAILSLSSLMTDSGMISVLAQKATFFLFPFFSPMIGTLGTFITGSNTSSNMLFGAFQYTTAKNMRINPLLILGSQTAGGAIGKVFSPTDIVLAASVTNILGREGEIMRFTVKIGIIFCILIGVLTMLMV